MTSNTNADEWKLEVERVAPSLKGNPVTSGSDLTILTADWLAQRRFFSSGLSLAEQKKTNFFCKSLRCALAEW